MSFFFMQCVYLFIKEVDPNIKTLTLTICVL